MAFRQSAASSKTNMVSAFGLKLALRGGSLLFQCCLRGMSRPVGAAALPDRPAPTPGRGRPAWRGLRFTAWRLSFAKRSHNSPGDRACARAAECFPMTEYNGYRIEPYEPTPGRWRARISRLDGKKLKTTIPPTEQRSSILWIRCHMDMRWNSQSRRSTAVE